MAIQFNPTNKPLSNSYLKRMQKDVLKKDDRVQDFFHKETLEILKKIESVADSEKPKSFFEKIRYAFFSTAASKTKIGIYNEANSDIRELVGYKGWNPLTRTQTKVDIIVFRLKCALIVLSAPEYKTMEEEQLKRELDIHKAFMSEKSAITIARDYIESSSKPHATMIEERIIDCLELEKEIVKGGRKVLNFSPVLDHPSFSRFDSRSQCDIFKQILAQRIEANAAIMPILKHICFSNMHDLEFKYDVFNNIRENSITKVEENIEIIGQISKCIKEALGVEFKRPGYLEKFVSIVQKHFDLYVDLFFDTIRKQEAEGNSGSYVLLKTFKGGLDEFFNIDKIFRNCRNNQKEIGLNFSFLIRCGYFKGAQIQDSGMTRSYDIRRENLSLTNEQRFQILQSVAFRVEPFTRNNTEIDDALNSLHGLFSPNPPNGIQEIETKINKYLTFVEFLHGNELKNYVFLGRGLTRLLELPLLSQLDPNILKRIDNIASHHSLIGGQYREVEINKEAVDRYKENLPKNLKFQELNYEEQAEVLKIIYDRSIDKESAEDIKVTVLSKLALHYFNKHVNVEKFKLNVKKYLGSITYFKLKEEEILKLDFQAILENNSSKLLDFDSLNEILEHVILRDSSFAKLIQLSVTSVQDSLSRDLDSNNFNKEKSYLRVVSYLGSFKKLASTAVGVDLIGYLDLNLIINSKHFFELDESVISELVRCTQYYTNKEQKETFILNILLKIGEYYLHVNDVNDDEFISNAQNYFSLLDPLEKLCENEKLCESKKIKMAVDAALKRLEATLFPKEKDEAGFKASFKKYIDFGVLLKEKGLEANFNLKMIAKHSGFQYLLDDKNKVQLWTFLESVNDIKAGEKSKVIIDAALKCVEENLFSKDKNMDKEDFSANYKKYLDFVASLKRHKFSEVNINLKIVVEHPSFSYFLDDKAQLEAFLETVKSFKESEAKIITDAALKSLEENFFSENKDQENFLANYKKYLDFDNSLKIYNLKRNFNFKLIAKNKNFASFSVGQIFSFLKELEVSENKEKEEIASIALKNLEEVYFKNENNIDLFEKNMEKYFSLEESFKTFGMNKYKNKYFTFESIATQEIFVKVNPEYYEKVYPKILDRKISKLFPEIQNSIVSIMLKIFEHHSMLDKINEEVFLKFLDTEGWIKSFDFKIENKLKIKECLEEIKKRADYLELTEGFRINIERQISEIEKSYADSQLSTLTRFGKWVRKSLSSSSSSPAAPENKVKEEPKLADLSTATTLDDELLGNK